MLDHPMKSGPPSTSLVETRRASIWTNGINPWVSNVVLDCHSLEWMGSRAGLNQKFGNWNCLWINIDCPDPQKHPKKGVYFVIFSFSSTDLGTPAVIT